MTINRSTLLDLPLPVTGTEDGTWGDVTNNGLTQYLDIAIAGMVSLTSSDFTLGGPHDCLNRRRLLCNQHCQCLCSVLSTQGFLAGPELYDYGPRLQQGLQGH
jgi:hypothetical protein